MLSTLRVQLGMEALAEALPSSNSGQAEAPEELSGSSQ